MLRVGILVLGLATFAACGGDGRERGDPADTATRAAGVVFEGDTLEGERVSLAEFRGKPVFVNVWASW
jgi:hypothetical protein